MKMSTKIIKNIRNRHFHYLRRSICNFMLNYHLFMVVFLFEVRKNLNLRKILVTIEICLYLVETSQWMPSVISLGNLSSLKSFGLIVNAQL